MATKTSPENISLFHLCYFAIISNLSTLIYKNGELSRNQIGRSDVQVQKENEKFTVVRSLSPQDLKCGHFMLLFCRGRQSNVPKCKTHLQSDCVCSLNLLFCGVVVAVVVAGMETVTRCHLDLWACPRVLYKKIYFLEKLRP